MLNKNKNEQKLPRNRRADCNTCQCKCANATPLFGIAAACLIGCSIAG